MKMKIQGYSILEVLISLVIGLIVIAGVVRIFISAKIIYKFQNNFFQMQENIYFLNEYLPKVIHQAGYRSTPASGQSFAAYTTVFATTPYVSGTNNTGPVNNNASTGSDTITVAYQGSGDGAGNPDGTVRDCLNQPIDSGRIATSQFSLDTNNNLQCTATNPNASPTTNTQILVSGVESFQVLYGEDTDNDGVPNRYVTSAVANMQNVIAVRVAILLKSSEDQVSPSPKSVTYQLLDQTYTPTDITYLRIPITFTILLRNRVLNNI